MKRLLAAVVLVGRCVADDAPTVAPEDDWRITKFTVGQPQKVGILTYYPNLGGGYTFLEHDTIVFYALPFVPANMRKTRSMSLQRSGPLERPKSRSAVKPFTAVKCSRSIAVCIAETADRQVVSRHSQWKVPVIDHGGRPKDAAGIEKHHSRSETGPKPPPPRRALAATIRLGRRPGR
jgi:hypothetical protein